MEQGPDLEPAGGCAVIYHWTIRPGSERAFEESWRRMTRAIHARCGSFGSRLHQAEDGTYLAYARWPSESARQACFADGDPDPEAARGMRDAVARHHPEIRLEIVDDLLMEPGPGRRDPGQSE